MRPLTGRKHQLRQHCVKILKTPILGERRYAQNREKDLHLLAYQVEFTHPETKKTLKIKAPLPKWLEKKCPFHN